MSTCPYIIRPLAVATVVRTVYEVPTQSPLCILLMATFGSQLVNITSLVYINKHILVYSLFWIHFYLYYSTWKLLILKGKSSNIIIWKYEIEKVQKIVVFILLHVLVGVEIYVSWRQNTWRSSNNCCKTFFFRLILLPWENYSFWHVCGFQEVDVLSTWSWMFQRMLALRCGRQSRKICTGMIKSYSLMV